MPGSLYSFFTFSWPNILRFYVSTSAILARVDTARGILNLLVYLDISTSGRRARITTSNIGIGPSGMRVKCEILALHALIVHEAPLPRSVAQSHEATRGCAALNSCVALANSPLLRRQVTARYGDTSAWMQSRIQYGRSRKLALVDAGHGSSSMNPSAASSTHNWRIRDTATRV